jgi:hypothetical protein
MTISTTFDYDVCASCNGSGEGSFDGSRCYSCRGTGCGPTYAVWTCDRCRHGAVLKDDDTEPDQCPKCEPYRAEGDSHGCGRVIDERTDDVVMAGLHPVTARGMAVVMNRKYLEALKVQAAAGRVL